MPVPVKYKCPKCGGETDTPNLPCIYCYYKDHIRDHYKTKHVHLYY